MGVRTFAPVGILAVVAAPGAEAQRTQPIDDMLEDCRWRSTGPTNMGGRVTEVEGFPSPKRRRAAVVRSI